MALRRNLPGFYPQQAAVPRSPFTPGIAPPAADPQQSFWQQMFSPGPQTVTPGQPGAHQGGLLPFSPQQQGLLGMAGALMEAGGPSFTPTSLGQGFGRGLTAMQGAQGRAEQVAMQRQGMNMQLAQATREQEREKAADERWSAMRESMPPQEAALLDSLPAESRNRVLAKRAEAQFAPPEDPTYAKPFPATEVATGNEVLITPEQFAAAPADYVPTDDAPPAPTALYRNLLEAGFKEGSPELQQAMQVALNKPQVKIDMGGELSPGQKKLDEAYAVDHADFVLSGSYADATRNLNQIDDVIRRLESGEDLTGGAMTALPDMVRERLDPIGFDTQQLVEEVVQRNLKVVLGAQFTEKEGERLISRAYNPRLEEPQNIGRLNRLAGAMREGLLARKQSADYFEKNGTMKGYKGARRITINDLNDAIEDKGPETKRAGGKKIPVNFAVMAPADLLKVDAANLTGEQLDELDEAMTKAGM